MPIINYEKFAERLRNAMDSKRISSAMLARAIWPGSPTPTRDKERVNDYRAGTCFPKKITLRRLAAALDVSETYFTAQGEPPKPYIPPMQSELPLVQLPKYSGVVVTLENVTLKNVPVEIVSAIAAFIKEPNNVAA